MYLIYVKSSIKVFCPADVHSVKRVSEMLQIVMVNTILPPTFLIVKEVGGGSKREVL